MLLQLFMLLQLKQYDLYLNSNLKHVNIGLR